MAELRALFRSDTQTQFIAVASPTPLAVAETRRLVAALAEQEVAVNHLVVNKVLAGGVSAGSVAAGADVDESVGSSGAAAAAAADAAVMATMRRGQAAALERATSPGSPLASVPQLTVTQVPLFDADISGVSGLRYMAAVAFAGKYEVADLRATTPLGNPSDDAAASMAVATRAGEVTARQDAWAKLTAPADDPRSSSYSSSGGDDGDREGVDQRFVVVGGKGGVGKTSTSAALAVACCETGGYNTVVVSTVWQCARRPHSLHITFFLSTHTLSANPPLLRTPRTPLVTRLELSCLGVRSCRSLMLTPAALMGARLEAAFTLWR